MAYVITEPCLSVKDKSCVAACPVDCIHAGIVEQDGKTYDQLFINPDACICCGLCMTECPVEAIFDDTDVLKQWQHFIALNADFFANHS